MGEPHIPFRETLAALDAQVDHVGGRPVRTQLIRGLRRNTIVRGQKLEDAVDAYLAATYPLTDAEADELARVLDGFSRRRNVQAWMLRAVRVLAYFAVILVFRNIDAKRFFWLMMCGASLLGILPALLVERLTRARTDREAMRRLGAFVHARCVGPLAEAYLVKDWNDSHDFARRPLLQSLPLLRPSDAPALTDSQRRCLHRLLLEGDLEVARAVLDALEQVGDGSAVDAVRRVAAGQGNAWADDALRRQAAALLPTLEQRAETARAAHTLLRAADSGSATETLLRPAHGADDTPAELLLRPTEGDDKVTG